MIYKVLVDLDKVDLNLLVKKLKNDDMEFCMAEDCLYFHTKYDTSTKISNLMKRVNTSGFVVKPVTEKPRHPEISFADLWCFEKMNEDELREFNENHQKELQTMMDNIESIRQAVEHDKLSKEEPKEDG